jgi:hypothetical protein
MDRRDALGLMFRDPTTPNAPSDGITPGLGGAPDGSFINNTDYFQRRFPGTVMGAMAVFKRYLSSSIAVGCKQGFSPNDPPTFPVSADTPTEYGDEGMSFVERNFMAGRFWFNLINIKVVWTESEECCDNKSKRLKYSYGADMVAQDMLGFSEDDWQNWLAQMDILFPPRVVSRGSWSLKGSGSCCSKN